MVIESLSITVFGIEFQIAATVQLKSRFANVALDDGWDSDVVLALVKNEALVNAACVF